MDDSKTNSTTFLWKSTVDMIISYTIPNTNKWVVGVGGVAIQRVYLLCMDVIKSTSFWRNRELN